MDQARRVASLVITSHFMNHVYQGLMPVLLPFIAKELSLSYLQVGLLTSGWLFTQGYLQAPMGVLRRFILGRYLLAFGMFWQGALNLASAGSRGFYDLLIYRSAAGIGSAPQHPIGASMLSEHFANKGRIMGINLSISWTGSAIAPVLGTVMAVALGWRQTLSLITIPGLLLGFPLWFLIKEEKIEAPERGAKKVKFSTAMMDRTILCIMIYAAISGLRGGLFTLLPVYFVRDAGMSEAVAGFLFSSNMIFMSLGSVIGGFVSDRMGKKNTAIMFLMPSIFLIALFPTVSDMYVIAGMMAVLGIAMPGISATMQALIADIANPQHRTSIFSIYYTITFGLASLGPIVLGVIADNFGFVATFTYVVIIGIVSLVPALMIREPKKATQKAAP